MSKVLKGSFELMKQLNISAVLKVLRTKENMSRADIAEITGLTPASVTNITKFLMEAGYLSETGIGKSSGGRPPIILQLNYDARYIIGVNIGVGIIEVVLTNLEAKIIAKESYEILDNDEEKKYGKVLKKLIEMINNVIEESGKPKDKIAGIGMAVHGVVNTSTGVSEFSPYYNWKNVQLLKDVKEEFQYPVFIDNDVRAMALGESWFGTAQNINSFITINISNGIGAGIIIDNKPYYGIDYSAGEIGHVVVDPDGPKCNCGNYGCLETIASNKSLVKKAIKLIKQGAETSIIPIDGEVENITIENICSEANNGDNLAITLLNDAGRYIGMVVSNMINILNPIQVVMVGKIIFSNDIVLDSINSTVKKIGFEISTKKVKIVKSMLGDNAAVIGAATLAIIDLFNGNGF